MKRMESYINLTLENAPPSYECYYYGEPCNWLYLGSSGRALSFWKLYQNAKFLGDNDKALYYL